MDPYKTKLTQKTKQQNNIAVLSFITNDAVLLTIACDQTKRNLIRCKESLLTCRVVWKATIV